MDLRDFFSAAEARIDRWRTLSRTARALAGTGPPVARGKSIFKSNWIRDMGE
jgi:hypothetical protein